MVKVAWTSCPSFCLPAIEARWYRLYWSRLLNNSCSMSWLRCRYWSRSFWVDGLIKWIVERISLINWTVLLVSRVIYFYYSIYYYHYSTQLKESAYSLNDHKYVYFWFKHILFMMKRIGRGLNATRALSWKEYLQGNSLTHTVIQQHEHIIKIHNIKTCD